MDGRLNEIQANLSRAADIKELQEEGVEDQNQMIDDLSWQSEVSLTKEEIGKWSALFTSAFCCLLHLPALALESCWPSLLGQMFSFYIAPKALTTSHWVALGATVVLVALTLGFLAVGAKRRRGLLPLMLAVAGSWLVVLNPVYYLLADYDYLHEDEPRVGVVGTLTILGVLILVCASAWNASIDKLVLQRFQGPPGKKHSCVSSAQGGAHTLVSGDSSDDMENPDMEVENMHL